MQNERDVQLGTDDLEKGMRPGHARDVAVILAIVAVTLASVNSGGFVKWTQSLPSAPHNAWLAERAAEWHDRMVRLGPAGVFEQLRKDLAR